MMVSIRSIDLALIVMIFMNEYNILREILRPFSVISNENSGWKQLQEMDGGRTVT